MQHCGNPRQATILYGATSRQHHPYSQTAPSRVHTVHSLLPSTSCEDPFDKDSCYPDCSQSSSQKLSNTLYLGSTPSLASPATSFNQIASGKLFNPIKVESNRNNRPSPQGHYQSTTSTLGSMSGSLMHSSSQSSFGSASNRESNSVSGSRVKSTKRPQGSPSKRPTPDEFRVLVLFPRDHETLILDYVGTDSKYTLAKNHAGMMVRSSIKSQDMAGKMQEVAEPLDAIDIFLGFLLEYQGLKAEQKGCVSLRICFGALTALLGDFSQGSSVENFVSDPHAAVISREYLPQFRSLNPELHEILYRLSAKLEKSMNLYRHRRSPSGSLVAKFQEMSDTLEVWNRYLMDDTFASPARIAADWLRNHPNQVDSRRRNQAYSEQTSPALSDTTRPSPSQCDSNYFSPMTVHGEPSRPSNRSNMHLTSLDGSNQYESLFKPSTGVTFFGPSSMGPSSLPYNPNLFRSPAGFDESMNLPSLTDGHALTMFAHHIHSPNNTYHATGSGYSSF